MSDIVIATEAEMASEAAHARQAKAIATKVGNALRKHYRGRSWVVSANPVGRVVTVYCPEISLRHGFVLHLDKLAIQLEQAAIKAGGEILERFGQNRHNTGGATLLRDSRGEAIAAAKGGI